MRRRAMAGAIGLMILMTACSESEADDPGATDPCEAQGMIWVYARITDASDHAYPSEVFRLENGAETQLTSLADPPEREASNAAAVAPDGSGRIVFARGLEGDPESAGYTRHRLYLMSSDGSGVEPLLDPASEPSDADLAWDTNPVWSPDGSRIAFVRNVEAQLGSNAGSVHSVMVVPADGGEPVAVSDGGSDLFDPAPAWSPDGTRLAWLTERSGTLHWAAIGPQATGEKAGGSGRVNLPGATGAPAWIDGGRRILVPYRHDSLQDDVSGLYRVDIAGRAFEEITLEGIRLENLWALPTGEIAGVETIMDDAGEEAESRIVVLDPARPADTEEIAAFDTTVEGIASVVPDQPDGWAGCLPS